jgi:hypothetical protein
MWLMFQNKILRSIISSRRGIEAKLKWRGYGPMLQAEGLSCLTMNTPYSAYILLKTLISYSGDLGCDFGLTSGNCLCPASTS